MAASAPASKTSLGWLVLAAALAVPGFLFFNWWSQMKADRERSVATKARGRLPEGAVFQTPPPGTKPLEPVVSSSAPAATTAAPQAAQGAIPAPPAAVAPAPAVIAAAAVPPTAVPPAAVAFATSAAAADIVLARDPMLSPMDAVRLLEEEMARERARLELEEANRRRNAPRRVVKRVEPPVEKHIELQGTVATPHGASLAIVNNATMSLGESFSVDGYSSKVRIVKISPLGVTFEYKKRRFTKSVNEE